MAKRKDISYIFDKFNDAQRVDLTDLETEQNRNVETDAGTIFNHFGTGVLPNGPEQVVLFDSDNLTSDQAAILAAGNFDGTGLQAQTQPTDINLGNQLEVELTGSDPWGRYSVKVAIIGLSFDDTLQIDKLYFYKNEKQVTSRHYKRILALFFNDFKGNNNCSRTLGGRITIKEAKSFQISRDPVMVAQDVAPDLFWRDFDLADLNLSLIQTIQDGIGPEFDATALNIDVIGQESRTLEASDVVSQVGQKFLATSDNIQKITLLLGVAKDEAAAVEDWFDWSGDLVFSVYALQNSTTCPTDIVPELAIDFDPDSQPLIQLSYNQTTLRDIGYVLTDVLQPVDFVLNATKLGTPGNVVVGQYYVATIKRSGAATTGKILIGTGDDRVEDSRVTLFNGVWVDVSDQDLWFQVWTDAVKVADGMGYDGGHGIMITKTILDTTGATIDYQFNQKPFVSTGQNITNIGVIQGVLEESFKEQDERNGNQVNARKQYVANFSFVDSSGLSELQDVTDPLIIGCVKDSNPKLNPTLDKTLTIPGLVKNDTFCIINPDADLLSLNLLGSKLIPNVGCNAKDYRIFRSTLCMDGYGDVTGTGTIDLLDITRASELIGESLFFESTQQKIIDGYIDTLELLRADVDNDGYITSDDVDLITAYVNREINSFPAGTSFTHLCLQVQQSIGRYDSFFDCDGYIRLDGYLGTNLVDSNSLSDSEIEYDGYNSIPQLDLDTVFTTVPFPGVSYQIIPQPYWKDHLLLLSEDTRLVPCVFTDNTGVDPAECSSTTELCQDLNDNPPVCDPGKNDFFIPDNLILNQGEILRPDGSNYKIDFEIGTVVLELPAVPLSEVSINIFEKLVVDRGDGLTSAGYSAMKYADCTTVQASDLALGRVKFNVSIQSFFPNLDGYSSDGYGIVIDDIIGVYMDHANGILQLNIQDLDEDNVFLTLVTKIQIIVYLKKGGWNNTVLTIPSTAIEGLIAV